MTDTPEETAPTSVTCPATKDPAIRTFIMAAIFLGIGIFCWIDAASGKYDSPEVWNMENINAVAGHILNHYTPWIAIPGGLLAAFLGIRSIKRIMEADAEGLGYRGKEKLPWDRITALDASQLKDKGILKVKYGDEDEIVLDSWKLQNFRDLVGFVESHSPVEPTK